MQNPNSPVQMAPSQEERWMALAAHLSILLPHVGVVVPLIIWLAHNDRAPFAAYQAKQAFWFHLLTIVGFWAFLIIAVALGIVTFGLGLLASAPLLLLWHFAADIYGIIGAVYCFQGRDFRYAVLGSIIQPS
jgi:uncharacterized Tic20 family protein